jgi:hypothetical protein
MLKSQNLVFVFLIAASNFFVVPVLASSERTVVKTVAVDMGVGYFSDYGAFGFGGRYFFTPNFDVHVSAGSDILGLMTGAGARYYLTLPFNECFFVFACKQQIPIGMTLLRSNGGKVSTSTDGIKADYFESQGFFLHAATGFYDSFSSGFAMGIELGYRFALDRPSVTYDSGTFSTAGKESVKKWSDNGVAFLWTLGWQF